MLFHFVLLRETSEDRRKHSLGGRGCHYGVKVEIGFFWSIYDMYDYGGY